MKKLTTLAMMGMVSCLSSFGQGYLIFNNSSTTAVFDNFTANGSPTKSPANVVDAILYHVGASNSFSGLGTTASGNANTSWSNITGALGAGWKWATLDGTALLSANTRSSGPTIGTFSGGTLAVFGTNPGDTISMYVVGWQLSSGATPDAALAAGGALGYSNPINELLGASASPGVSMNAAGMTAFTVSPTLVPEPATFALAGLGAAAMLIFRRRK